MSDVLRPEPIEPFPSRDAVKKIIEDFSAIREKFRADPRKDESHLSVQVEFAKGYLEEIMNLPDDERKNWEEEIEGLGGILWMWEHRSDESQWEQP